MNPLADLVREERLRRKWSIRRACIAAEGEISNTWWSQFEKGTQPLTEGIARAVAKAYGWSDEWATQPDDEGTRRLDELAAKLDHLVELVSKLPGHQTDTVPEKPAVPARPTQRTPTL